MEKPLHDPLVQCLLLIHFVSVGGFLLQLYHMILLLVGSGDPAISFGHLEVFLRRTLPAHEFRGQTAVRADVGRGEIGLENRKKR